MNLGWMRLSWLVHEVEPLWLGVTGLLVGVVGLFLIASLRIVSHRGIWED